MSTPALIDDFMPRWDVTERHRIIVHAPPADVYEAVLRVDLSRSRPIAVLAGLRELPAKVLGRQPANPGASIGGTIDGFLAAGFVRLAETANEELVLGLTGRFWTPTGAMLRVAAEDFTAFNRPGYAQAVWNIAVTPTRKGATRLTTETRVRCTDRRSLLIFRAYWLVVRPFSGWIRKEMLRLIKEDAEERA